MGQLQCEYEYIWRQKSHNSLYFLVIDIYKQNKYNTALKKGAFCSGLMNTTCDINNKEIVSS